MASKALKGLFKWILFTIGAQKLYIKTVDPGLVISVAQIKNKHCVQAGLIDESEGQSAGCAQGS